LNLVGETLRQRLIKARKELARQKEGLEEFSKAQQGEVSAWKKAVDDFETGASAVSPYELPHAGKRFFSAGSFSFAYTQRAS
jgi:hypothetical protein